MANFIRVQKKAPVPMLQLREHSVVRKTFTEGVSFFSLQ